MTTKCLGGKHERREFFAVSHSFYETLNPSRQYLPEPWIFLGKIETRRKPKDHRRETEILQIQNPQNQGYQNSFHQLPTQNYEKTIGGKQEIVMNPLKPDTFDKTHGKELIPKVVKNNVSIIQKIENRNGNYQTGKSITFSRSSKFDTET